MKKSLRNAKSGQSYKKAPLLAYSEVLPAFLEVCQNNYEKEDIKR